MVRAPYPARIAAGLIVTAIEETRKLPTLLVTLPMTAVSQTLQAGMRAQQSIAELAIKGDSALELIFDRPAEEPTWARFDEDELDVIEPAIPIESTPAKVATPVTTDTPVPAPKSAPAKEPGPAKESAPTAAKKAAPVEPAPAAKSPTARPDTGRFALYSSAPEAVVESANDEPARPASEAKVKAPEIVEYIEYNGLTLAQLRAKLRSVSVEDLAALSSYEKATRNRAPFVTMLDNRISAAENKRPSTT